MTAVDGDGVQQGLTKADIQQVVEETLYAKFEHMLGDLSFRIQQVYDLLDRVPKGDPRDPRGDRIEGAVYAEDLNLLTHQLTGYAVTANTPVANSIAWTDLHIVYAGVDYNIANANTANRFAYWDSSVSTTVLQTSATKPVLDNGDVLVFVNDLGTPRVALGASIPAAVQNGAVDSGAILANAVTTAALAPNAVTSAELADNALSRTGQLGTNVVTSTAVADNALSRAAQLAANVVGAGKIADGALNRSGILTANVVTATAVADGAVSRAGVLAANVVSTGAIADGAVTRVNQLGANVVTTTQLANDAVTNNNIANAAVGTNELQTGAVTPVRMNTFQHMFY